MGFLTDQKQENGVTTKYAKIDEVYINTTLKQVKVHITYYTSKEDRDNGYLPVSHTARELNMTPPTTNEDVDNRPKEIAAFPWDNVVGGVYTWLKTLPDFSDLQDL